jgi:hypothetical protein
MNPTERRRKAAILAYKSAYDDIALDFIKNLKGRDSTKARHAAGRSEGEWYLMHRGGLYISAHFFSKSRVANARWLVRSVIATKGLKRKDVMRPRAPASVFVQTHSGRTLFLHAALTSVENRPRARNAIKRAGADARQEWIGSFGRLPAKNLETDLKLWHWSEIEEFTASAIADEKLSGDSATENINPNRIPERVKRAGHFLDAFLQPNFKKAWLDTIKHNPASKDAAALVQTVRESIQFVTLRRSAGLT